MSKETSLSEFVGKAAEPDESAGPDEPVAPDERDESREDAADLEPASATYDWTPGGANCACCDTAVEERWRDDGGMVCADCKEW